MKKPNEYPVEDLLTNESFLNFYFKKKMDDQLDWEDWADESPANAARAAEATRLLDRLSLKWGAGQIREHWAEVQAQISAEQTPIFRLKTQIGWGKWAAIAASFLVAAAVGFGIWQSSRADEMLALTNDHHDRLMIFKLPDGSKLQVKPHSKVLISHDFGQKTRDLHLTGEAIFEVAKDPARPFRVYADALTVTALGTTFGIRANEGEAELKVVLTEGKIRVENKSESAPQADELIAGEEIRLNVREKRLLPKRKTTAPAPAPKTEIKSALQSGSWIQFNQTPFGDVATSLEYNFNVHFNGINPELGNLPVSYRFRGDRSLRQILHDLGEQCHFGFEMRGAEIFIKKEMTTFNGNPE